MKGYFEDIFDTLKASGTLVLKLPASKAIIDHCVCCLFNNFSELYSIMKNEGNITEEVYERMGFPVDTNYYGKEVKKPDAISQDIVQRYAPTLYSVTSVKEEKMMH